MKDSTYKVTYIYQKIHISPTNI